MLAPIAMIRPLLALLALALPVTSAHAVPGGELGTLENGKWFCEKPGDAAAPSTPLPRESFVALPDSAYRAADGTEGVYLLLGDELVMTSGALRGHRFKLDSAATMHRLDAEGDEIDQRCVRAGDPAANHLAGPREPGSVEELPTKG